MDREDKKYIESGELGCFIENVEESFKQLKNYDELYYTNSAKELLDYLDSNGYSRFVYFRPEDLYITSDYYIHDDMGKIGRRELGCTSTEYCFIYSSGHGMADNDLECDSGWIYVYPNFEIFDRDNGFKKTSLYKYLGEPMRVDEFDDIGESLTESVIDWDSEGNQLNQQQVNYFKDSKIRNDEGKLLVVYHGTDKNFDTFNAGDIGFHFGTKGQAEYVTKEKETKLRNIWDNKKSDEEIPELKDIHVDAYYLNIKNPALMYDFGPTGPYSIAFWWWSQSFDNYGHIFEFDMTEEELAQINKVFFENGGRTYGTGNEETDIADDYTASDCDQCQDKFLVYNSPEAKLLRDLLKKRGYDGIYYYNNFEDADESNDLSFIAFEPNQIKRISNWEPTSANNINEDDEDVISAKEIYKEIVTKSQEEIIGICNLDKFHDTITKDAGPAFILQDGRYIYVKDYGFNTHTDFARMLLERYAKAVYPDKHVTELFVWSEDTVEGLLDTGWIRVNTGSSAVDKRFYCVLPGQYQFTPTSKQFDSLLNYFDLNAGNYVFVYLGVGGFKFDLKSQTTDDLIKDIKRYYRFGTIQEDLDEFDSIVKTELDTLNRWLDEYGFEAKLITDKETLDEIDWKKQYGSEAVGMFLQDIQDNASVFPIALNKKVICKICKEEDLDLREGIEGTLLHEAGHGIYRFLEDVMDMPEDEEDCVEEFARYRENSDLFDILQEYMKQEESLKESLKEIEQTGILISSSLYEIKDKILNSKRPLKLVGAIVNGEETWLIGNPYGDTHEDMLEYAEQYGYLSGKYEKKNNVYLNTVPYNKKINVFVDYSEGMEYDYTNTRIVDVTNGHNYGNTNSFENTKLFKVLGEPKESKKYLYKDHINEDLKEETDGKDIYYRGYDSRYGVFDSGNEYGQLYTWVTDEPEYALEYAENNEYGKVAKVRITCNDDEIGGVLDLPEDVDYYDPGDEEFQECILDQGLKGYGFEAGDYDDFCICISKDCVEVVDPDVEVEVEDESLNKSVKHINENFKYIDGVRFFDSVYELKNFILNNKNYFLRIVDFEGLGFYGVDFGSVGTHDGICSVAYTNGLISDNPYLYDDNAIVTYPVRKEKEYLDGYYRPIYVYHYGDLGIAEVGGGGYTFYNSNLYNALGKPTEEYKIDDEVESLTESKQDIEKFRQWAGDELADRFFAVKNRLKGELKDVYYWISLEKKLGPNKELAHQNALDSLEYAISDVEVTPTKKERQELAKNGSEKIYEDERWLVLKINSFEASVKYGKHTQWCITGTNSGMDGGRSDWNYHSDNDMYFFIDKQKDTKYALEFKDMHNWCLYNDQDYVEVGEGDIAQEAVNVLGDPWSTEYDTHYPAFPKIDGLPDLQQAYKDVIAEEGADEKSIKVESLNEDLNVLDALDKEFGQEELYMWSTYILPNGHFLNPDNAKEYWDEIGEDPIYEHCDFEDWAYQKGYNLSDIYNNCIKMNVTYPYLSMPDKAKPTQEQFNAIRKILDRKDLFEPEGKFYWYDIFPEEKVDSKGENLLAVYTPVGDELFDLDVNDADDIIRAINQAYVRGGFFTESLNESKADWEKFRQWCNDDELYNRFVKSQKRFEGKYKDIYYWMGLEKKYGKHGAIQELQAELRNIEETPTAKEKAQLAKDGTTLLYNGNGWKVFQIDTYEASRKYGKGTNWCISGDDMGYDYFGDYHDSGDRIIFFIKDDDTKYAVVIDGSYWTIYDGFDNIVSHIPGAPKVDGVPDVSKIKDEVIRAIVQLYNVKPSEIEDVKSAFDDSEMMEFFWDYDTREAYAVTLKNGKTKFMYFDGPQAEYIDVTDDFVKWAEEYM